MTDFEVAAILITLTAGLAYINARLLRLPSAIGLMATALLWWTLDVTGVFAAIGRTIDDGAGSGTSSFDFLSLVGFSRVMGIALVLTAIEIVLGSALADGRSRSSRRDILAHSPIRSNGDGVRRSENASSALPTYRYQSIPTFGLRPQMSAPLPPRSGAFVRTSFTVRPNSSSAAWANGRRGARAFRRCRPITPTLVVMRRSMAHRGCAGR